MGTVLHRILDCQSIVHNATPLNIRVNMRIISSRECGELLSAIIRCSGIRNFFAVTGQKGTDKFTARIIAGRNFAEIIDDAIGEKEVDS